MRVEAIGERLHVKVDPVLTGYFAVLADIYARRPYQPPLIPGDRFDDVRRFVLAVDEVGDDLVSVERALGASSHPSAEVRLCRREGSSWRSMPRSWSAIGQALDALAPTLVLSPDDAHPTRICDVLTENRAAVAAAIDELWALLNLPDRGRTTTVLVPIGPASSGNVGGQDGFSWVASGRFPDEYIVQAVLEAAVWTTIEDDRSVEPNANLLTSVVEHMTEELHDGWPADVIVQMIVNLATHHVVFRQVNPSAGDAAKAVGFYHRYAESFRCLEPHWRRYVASRLDCDGLAAAVAHDLARSASIDRERQLPDVAPWAADFYALDYLVAEYGGDESRKDHAALVDRLSDSFADYLLLAIGAELSHVPPPDIRSSPARVRSFLEQVTAVDSRLGLALRFDDEGPLAVDLAAEAFALRSTRIGGTVWEPMARLLARRHRGQLPAAAFVDQCLSLEHNTGSVFNKMYDTERLPIVLEAQAETDLGQLYALASEEVRSSWHAQVIRARATDDPVWLGVQLLDPTPVADTMGGW